MAKKSAPAKSADQSVPLRFGDKGYLAAFERAVQEQSKETLKSPKTARESLMKAGIVTPSGNLTKNYR